MGEAKVLLNAFMIGGNLVAVEPGLTKWAAIKFFPVLAKTEKSCYLLSGSKPAPNIYFLRTIWCFLYLLVGDSKFSAGCSTYYEILNVWLNLSTIEWFNTLFYIYWVCFNFWGGSLDIDSFNDPSGGGNFPDSFNVGSFFGICYFWNSDFIVVFFWPKTLLVFIFSQGWCEAFRSFILMLPNNPISKVRSFTFSLIIFLI